METHNRAICHARSSPGVRIQLYVRDREVCEEHGAEQGNDCDGTL